MGKTVAAVVGVVAAIAIAVAAPYLAPLALSALGITATATAIAVATAVISIGLSLAVSLAFRALGVGAPSAKAQVGPPQVFRQSISNSFIVYGKRRVGGLLVFYHAKQNPDGSHWRYFVIAVAGHRCRENVISWMLNDEVVTVGGGGAVTSGKYAGAATLTFTRGLSTQTADATLVSECDGKWTTNHRGRGIAYITARFKLTDDVVQAGMPNITAIIEGRDEILDTRDSTYKYTRNAALIFYDFKQIPREEGGFGAYADEIPPPAWINAQANVCDETVNSNVRYAIDAVIQTGAAPSEIRDMMVVAQAGTYCFSGGKHLMRPGYWVPPSSTLSEGDVAGPIQVSPFLPPDTAANEVQGTYISPAANYQAAPLTTWTTAPAPGDVKQLDVDLPFVTNKDQGDRVIAIMGKRAQCEKTVVWPMNIAGLAVQAMDTTQLASIRYGLDNYAWTVGTWGLSADFGIVQNLREENEDIYEDGAPVAPVTPPSPSVPNPVRTIAEIQLILSRVYLIGWVDAVDAGSNATIRIYGGTLGSGTGNFTLDYPAGSIADLSVAHHDITGKAYTTDYWPYIDVDPGTLLPSTYGAATVPGDALNSAAHPYRIGLARKVTTPAALGGTSSGTGTGGGGYGGGGTGSGGVQV